MEQLRARRDQLRERLKNGPHDILQEYLKMGRSDVPQITKLMLTQPSQNLPAAGDFATCNEMSAAYFISPTLAKLSACEN